MHAAVLLDCHHFRKKKKREIHVENYIILYKHESYSHLGRSQQRSRRKRKPLGPPLTFNVTGAMQCPHPTSSWKSGYCHEPKAEGYRLYTLYNTLLHTHIHALCSWSGISTPPLMTAAPLLTRGWRSNAATVSDGPVTKHHWTDMSNRFGGIDKLSMGELHNPFTLSFL